MVYMTTCLSPSILRHRIMLSYVLPISFRSLSSKRSFEASFHPACGLWFFFDLFNLRVGLLRPTDWARTIFIYWLILTCSMFALSWISLWSDGGILSLICPLYLCGAGSGIGRPLCKFDLIQSIFTSSISLAAFSGVSPCIKHCGNSAILATQYKPCPSSHGSTVMVYGSLE